MNIRIFTLSLLSILIPSLLLAQKGVVRGTITDKATSETIIGATVALLDGEGTTIAAAYTDLDGKYSLEAAVGTYKLFIKYISYTDLTIEDVELVASDVNVLDLELAPEDFETETVVITAKAIKNTEASTLNMQRNSNVVVNAISSQQISRAGDSDVGAAMKRVTGVTVEGGKYVYVRGLGDRYSKATLNNAEIPGLDPNRNTVQMDMFPANLVDNIVVSKTYSPDMPGNFSGGLVDVHTKDFPDRFSMQISGSWGYNTNATFNDNYILYEGGKWDWLGFDDGGRALPEGFPDADEVPTMGVAFGYPNTDASQELHNISRSFNAIMAPENQTAIPNQSYSFSVGNQVMLGRIPVGFVASLSYKNSFEYYDEGRTARWKLTGVDSTKDGLDPIIDLSDQRGSRQSLWGALGNLSFKFSPTQKLSINYMHNQSGEAAARYQIGQYPENGWDENHLFETRTLTYTQRSLDALQIKGDHILNEDNKMRLDWTGSFTLSQQDEPDTRFFSDDLIIGNEDTTYQIQPSLYNPASRYFRNLQESNINLKTNFEYPFAQWNDKESMFKAGGSYVRKDREFTERRIEYNQALIDFYGDEQQFFADSAGIFVLNNGDVAFNVVQDESQRSNNYQGVGNIYAAYAMIELPLSARWKAITGVRYEGAQIEVESENPSDEKGTLDNNDFLPAINLIFSAKENMNLRLAYSRTLARPTFRELAPYASFDFVGDFVLIGNPDLKRTLIDNLDIRWELYMTRTEMVAVSGFYKHFLNPIEKQINPQVQGSSREYKLRNVDEAQLAGVEVEFRKKFAKQGFLSNFSAGGNFTFVYSRVDIDSLEFEAIKAVRTDAKSFRPMFGQSPYSVNGELSYKNDSTGTIASLSYNVFGARISNVGAAGTPDVYEQPRGLMNFTLSQRINNRFNLKLKATNLLNPKYEMVHNFKDQEFVFQSFRKGRTFSIGLDVNFD